MCIAALAWDEHPRWRLVALANRDEFHARAAAPLAKWPDGTLAGRDLLAGGTWLGVRPDNGRMVLVTNHRADGFHEPRRASRGDLVRRLLAGADPADEPVADYNPFNIFCLTGNRLWLVGNYPQEERRQLPPGIHGLSNGPFTPPWPKTRALCGELGEWLAGPADEPAHLLALLGDERQRPAAPGETGPEARFSGVFIRNPTYGTRCSTVILIDRSGSGKMIERRFDSSGATTGETTLRFTMATPAPEPASDPQGLP